MSCPRFVQNAWKRDLCSNCFKGKEDHAPVIDQTAIYLSKLKEITKRPPPPGILKGAVRKNVSAFKVHFPSEESQVIGYGGDEFSDNDDEGDFSVEETPKLEEDPTDAEEDKKFQLLTEENTDFNKDPKNLMLNEVSIKPIETIKKIGNPSLKLGQVKSNGDSKKPLLVSVQPFGSPTSTTPLSVSRKTHLNNLLHEDSESTKTNSASKENKNSTIILTSTPEILVDNKTDVHSDKSVSDFKPLIETITTSEIPYVNNVIVNSPVEPIVENISTKNEVIETESNNKLAEKLAESRLNSLVEGKKNTVTRGKILTKSHEQAKRYFQLGPINSNDNISLDENLYKKLESSEKNNSNMFSKAKDTISIKTSVQQKNSRNLTEGLFSSKLMKKEFGIQSDLQLKKLKSIDSNESGESAIDEAAQDDIKKVIGNSNSVSDELLVGSLTKIFPVKTIERTDEDDVFLINGVPAESREMAGEPDGRADSDDLDEPPPDLPTTPPPLLTDHNLRPSFLHSISKDKPQLPVKPNFRESTPPKELVLDLTQMDTVAPDPSLSPSSRLNLIKRQAPKPPPIPLGESPPKMCESPTSDSPPGCRVRASSCSPLPSDSSSNSSNTPEPDTNRRSLSLSNEALVCSTQPPPGLDKKKSNKMKTTLRRFLRLTSKDEFKCEDLGPPPLPPPRPRPEIIHPLDLNKSGVQVLRGDGTLLHSNKVQNFSEPAVAPTSSALSNFLGRPSKPPPPPRSQSLDCTPSSDNRPVRPPPPITQRLSDPDINTNADNHSVYVNLGEVRSQIAPVKPQRSASLREKDNDVFYQPSTLQVAGNPYESLVPECDSSREKTSLPYYGSETESDIYCPFTLSSSLKAADSRTVVHKSLEDNYGAVVVANYKALTQLMEQVSQGPQVPPALRPIKSCPTLQWTDFTVDCSISQVVGGRVFLPAMWEQSPVTLCLTAGQARLPPTFMPVTQFFDIVASQFLHQDKTELVQVSVAVLARQQVFSLQSFATQLPSYGDVATESALLMVQIISCLRTLQTQGCEEANISQFVLSRDIPQANPRVCVLPQEISKGRERVSLCQCALKALEFLQLPDSLAALIHSVLSSERSTSLTQAKGALELWLWGPTQVPLSTDIQVNLQRWLDLERATCLQSLVVRRPLSLTCGDYCHLAFLVGTNAKAMADALSLLDQHAAIPRS